ncbi:MAG TPA: carboxypeptidase-like regulatory domain-containing protein [Thermoanaerobaculia bacterium]|jgi:hypothetical protein|nr:carboxypeptidase-like regulatory domain-containing protein [Thermoanaerobaculia bacterium]
MRGFVFVALLASAFESRASTDPTSIQLFSVDKSAQPVCLMGRLHAVPRCSGSACGDVQALTAEWTFRGGSAEAQLSLRPEVSWEVSIEGKGCWAPPLIIAGGNNGETRTAFVWPAATIAGVFTMQKGETPPKELHATVEADDAAAPGAAIPQTSLDCSVEDTGWHCAVPATKVDLRFSADGFVPRYVWGLEVPAGKKKTLDIALTRGASVSGRVALSDRRVPLEGVDVELRPAGFAATPVDERRISARSRKTGTAVRGFFQFPSVDEGTYDVVATKKGWSRATRRVRVGGAKESDAGILTLPPLVHAEVIIDPALDTKGRRWRVVLDRDAVPMQHLLPLADKLAAVDGTWRVEALEAGKYRLEVFDGGGVAYERLIVDIQPGEPSLRFHMDALLVSGVVRIGRDPLAATLHFLNQQGSGDLNLISNATGAFAGTFPAAGQYLVEISPKESAQRLRTHVEVQPNAEGIVKLDIELPGGVVVGKVVDETGNPVSAGVQILPGGGRQPMSTMAAEDGTFRLIGVDRGDIVLNARSLPIGESGPVPFTVGDGTSEPVTLTLHPRHEFTVWIVSPSGQPVAGAVVRFNDGHYSHEVIAGPDGDVRFTVARGIDSIDVVIAAAGFPIRMMNLPIAADMDPNPQVSLGGVSALLVAKVAGAPPWPGIRPMPGNVNLHYLPELFASPMGGPSFPNRTARGYEFELDPGIYLLCPEPHLPEKCFQSTLAPGTETIVDFTSSRDTESKK